MIIVENISVQGFRGRRYLSIRDISCRDATLVDRRMSWQLSGIGNVLDYHPVENCRVFVARASPTAETERNRAKSFDLDWPIFSSSVQTRALSARQETDCCFLSHICSNLTYAIALATPLSVGRMTTDATECFSITVCFGQKRFIFLAILRIYLASCILV